MAAVYPIVEELFDNLQDTGESLEWPLVLKLLKLALSPRTEQCLTQVGEVLRELAKDVPALLVDIDDCCGRTERPDAGPRH